MIIKVPEPKLEWDATEAEKMLADFISQNEEIIARQIAVDAKANINRGPTGNLQKGIKAKKSMFEDGGWIVRSGMPHAWIVEHGHGGPRPAPPHPYLMPALKKNINAAKALFGVK